LNLRTWIGGLEPGLAAGEVRSALGHTRISCAAVTVNCSGRSFADEIRAFAAWLGAEPTTRVHVLAYDYSRATDWSFPDAPEVDATSFEAILRSAASGAVELSVVAADRGTLVVALEYRSGMPGRHADV